ncbi:unnamed protein product [Spodoptera exigua]|nr:unnamed protein product [Spodoptera exigua]
MEKHGWCDGFFANAPNDHRGKSSNGLFLLRLRTFDSIKIVQTGIKCKLLDRAECRIRSRNIDQTDFMSPKIMLKCGRAMLQHEWDGSPGVIPQRPPSIPSLIYYICSTHSTPLAH